MTKTPTKAPGLDKLSMPERILLFCIASGTAPPKTRITQRTIEGLTIKGLIKREPDRLALTQLGRATMNALMSLP